MHRRSRFCFAIALAAVALASPGVATATPPATYDDFELVSTAAELEHAIENEPSRELLYIEPGTYLLDNPVVINRTTSLYLHGADRQHTTLQSRDPSQPLFVVEAADVVNFANVLLAPDASQTAADVRALLVRSTSAVTLELLQVSVLRSVVEFRGPGSFRMQAPFLAPMGFVTSPVIVDHPDAELLIVGGNASNPPAIHPHVRADDYVHVHQKRGRLRILGLAVQATPGRSDFRIDRASALGPHEVVGVRSEGNNNQHVPLPGTHPATLVRVPDTTDAVDLVIKSNSGDWTIFSTHNGRLVDYNAAGTVWLLGNTVNAAGRSLVVGETAKPTARYVALGNILRQRQHLLDVGAGSKIFAGNIWERALHLGLDCADPNNHPCSTYINPGASLADYPRIPPIPDTRVPEPLTLPRLTRPLPGGGMLDVTAPPFGATPNDPSDDDAIAINAALAAQCAAPHGAIVFLPPGEYRIRDSIKYRHTDAACAGNNTVSGGWLVGAGKQLTSIVRDAGVVFETEGAAYMTIQGIAFRTRPFVADGSVVEPAVSLENVAAVGTATQMLMFHDVAFDGGVCGAGLALETNGNTSEQMFVHSEFRNAQIGLCVGAQNAHSQGVYRGVFENNDIALGQALATSAGIGGGWYVLGAEVSGSRVRDLSLRASGTLAWYLNEYVSRDPAVVVDQIGAGGHNYPLLIENSTITGSNPAEFRVFFDGGPIFLRSRVDALNLRLESREFQPYAFRLYSDVGGFDSAVLEGAAAPQLYSLDDHDQDSVADGRDSCMLSGNDVDPDGDQTDSDADGFGNPCDFDYDNDGATGLVDFALLREHFGKPASAGNQLSDADADGVIGILDALEFSGAFMTPPGPSGLACAGPDPTDFYASDFSDFAADWVGSVAFAQGSESVDVSAAATSIAESRALFAISQLSTTNIRLHAERPSGASGDLMLGVAYYEGARLIAVERVFDVPHSGLFQRFGGELTPLSRATSFRLRFQLTQGSARLNHLSLTTAPCP